ncbi:MAG: AmmeMemoRadiSam system protein B [Candidatus Omnitrophica bacterium]|nr:AmmeMemoRadiSam system protein B [Candidatus Omnitrophota bacterium]MDD5436941.1 AmmeMemoRadiSam system protein B [Candidatus Omnitrophota bacterium]
MEPTREAVVAGQFYPGTEDALAKEIRGMIDPKAARRDCLGVVSPHAGYIYSGNVAGSVFSRINPVPVYVIIGPNHTGLGRPFGISQCRSWKTPLGEVIVDAALAAAIKKNSGRVEDDDISHKFEHSIEVQLPFLQYLHKDFRIVPIVAAHAGLSAYREVGGAIAEAIKESSLEKKVVVVASSDMTHYEPQAEAAKKDNEAIKAILALDEKALLERIGSFGISMCGYAPVAIMIAAAKALGAKKAELVKYATSGDVTGDTSSVVGYAGLIIY